MGILGRLPCLLRLWLSVLAVFLLSGLGLAFAASLGQAQDARLQRMEHRLDLIDAALKQLMRRLEFARQRGLSPNVSDLHAQVTSATDQILRMEEELATVQASLPAASLARADRLRNRIRSNLTDMPRRFERLQQHLPEKVRALFERIRSRRLYPRDPSHPTHTVPLNDSTIIDSL